jgi:hypothetical protein
MMPQPDMAAFDIHQGWQQLIAYYTVGCGLTPPCTGTGSIGKKSPIPEYFSSFEYASVRWGGYHRAMAG